MASKTITCSYIPAGLAATIDKEIMSDVYGYSVEQLMELAGHSIATAVCSLSIPTNRILFLCGPGNNGGDGLVAARHLKQRQCDQFESNVTVLYPKKNSNDCLVQNLYSRLLDQAEHEGCKIITDIKETSSSIDIITGLNSNFDIAVDAFFGFGFKGSMREPYNSIIQILNETTLPIVCVDVPSGCNDTPDLCSTYVTKPSMIVSLMVPKLCTKFILERPENSTCIHYLGQPNLPRHYKDKYSLNVPRRVHSNDTSIIRLNP
ncbi:NAD(P)H-hydrate epimerase-like [Hylaeus volcanicus]|uniref:NAD(P)H-hydrate epimerase-like n=1 Tax=Hylaeus volcanicus TaxID=313075 RepID=UPI0023B8798A|nr:NAD(P)H-hydrate epimerase-like [Hylaeus volcanicus]XP_053992680.1 NAD(P)H-hydrate epimerase-like [Hylaeus volcanicus]XP_053992681.1 NAD(P)H-hydrate epimerase-like [Hylaeus volcanicus]